MAFAALSISKQATAMRKRKAAAGLRSAHFHAAFGRIPASLPPAPIPIAPVIQPKVKVGEPNDRFEQEADRVAEEVMRSPPRPVTAISRVGPTVQRTCAECTSGHGACPECAMDAERELIQRKAAPSPEAETLSIPAGSLSDLGPGRPLDGATRAFFEPRFGQGFSAVRVHTCRRAHEMAEALGAHAFTVGQNVVFGSDHYAPETAAGKKLLGHELTHVVQQAGREAAGGPGLMVQRQEEAIDPARSTVAGHPRIDVRAQFALLRLFRSADPAERQAARELLDAVDIGAVEGIYGDDLGKAVGLAKQRDTVRWELVPKGQDAVLIDDGLPGTPVVVFRESAGSEPRLDVALVSAWRSNRSGGVKPRELAVLDRLGDIGAALEGVAGNVLGSPSVDKKCDDLSRPIDDSEQVFLCTTPLSGPLGAVFNHAFFRIGNSQPGCGPTYSLYPELRKEEEPSCFQGVPRKDFDVDEKGPCVRTPIKWSCVHKESSRYPWGRYCVPAGPNSNTFVRVLRDACGDARTEPPEGRHPGFAAKTPESGKGTIENAFGFTHSVFHCAEIACGAPREGFK